MYWKNYFERLNEMKQTGMLDNGIILNSDFWKKFCQQNFREMFKY